MKKLTRRLAASAFTVSLFALTPAGAKPVTFAVGDAKNRDVVSFTSDAPVELIVGKTSNVNGTVVIDESMDLSKPIQATFAVDLPSIDTGIELRNEHMRDNFLETAKYPKATFTLKTLSRPGVLKVGQKQRLTATGDFTLHGKTVSKTVPVDVTYFKKCAGTETKMPGCDLIQINTEFKVPFADHGIKRPEIVFQKLADTVIVKLGATAYYKASPKAAAPSVPFKPAVKKS